MQATLDDYYAVFVREESTANGNPTLMERELVQCPTYEQAEWVRRECSGPLRKCVIRYVGPAGGGD